MRFIILSALIPIFHFIDSPPPCPDKTEKPVGMNIKFRLAEEGELEEGPAGRPTLELVLEKEEVLLEEEELRGQRQSQQRQQFCTKATENDRTEPCSADSSQALNSGPDANP